MIWTAWRNEATMVTPAPMPVARRFAYEYYISYPSNLSWIPFSCSKHDYRPSDHRFIVWYVKSRVQFCARTAYQRTKMTKPFIFFPLTLLFFLLFEKKWIHLYIQYPLQVIAFEWITSDFFSYNPWIQSKNFHYISIVCIITNNNIIQIILIQSNWVLIVY